MKTKTRIFAYCQITVSMMLVILVSSACAQKSVVEESKAIDSTNSLSSIPSAKGHSSSASSNKRITSYKDCVAAGNPSTKSLPPRCSTADGRTFVAELKRPPKPSVMQVIQDGKTERKQCVDKCGDGTCAEMVCFAIGCPCAESPSSCPQDCAP